MDYLNIPLPKDIYSSYPNNSGQSTNTGMKHWKINQIRSEQNIWEEDIFVLVEGIKILFNWNPVTKHIELYNMAKILSII